MITVHNLSDTASSLSECVADMRDVNIQSQREVFRANLLRVGAAMAYEISKQLAYEQVEVQTPLAMATGQHLKSQPVLATVFRAGLPLYEGMLQTFPYAESAFVGAYRKHESDGTLKIQSDYCVCPSLAGRTLILADPMLATGGSMAESVRMLVADGGTPAELHIAAVVASRDGIDFLSLELVRMGFNDATIWCAVIDPSLNDKQYIVPGLGDAGDLALGEKRQG